MAMDTDESTVAAATQEPESPAFGAEPEASPPNTEESTGPTQTPAEKPVSTIPDNTIYVGKKGVMSYVLAVVTQFNNGQSEVTVKARGKSISRAVDVAEIVRNRFLKDTKVQAISIGTEQITPREGGNPRNVSTMEITLKKE